MQVLQRIFYVFFLSCCQTITGKFIKIILCFRFAGLVVKSPMTLNICLVENLSLFFKELLHSLEFYFEKYWRKFYRQLCINICDITIGDHVGAADRAAPGLQESNILVHHLPIHWRPDAKPSLRRLVPGMKRLQENWTSCKVEWVITYHISYELLPFSPPIYRFS